MAGLKEIRNRITSIKSTQQITSAMKMVSASKLRKAQMSIVKLRPFAQKFNEILKNLGTDIDNIDDGKYSVSREPKNILIIPVASNRGLCGSFNSAVIRATNNVIIQETLDMRNETNLKSQISNLTSNISLICVGRKVYDYYHKRKYNVIDNFSSIFDSLTYENADVLAEKVIKLYLDKKFDKVIMVYNRFKNAAVQELSVEQLLPLQIQAPVSTKPKADNKKEEVIADYIFEPSRAEILRSIIPNYLKMNFYKMILESNASEHGARMTAMHLATDNASEILKQLRLSYNKARQASITKELLEIVSGAEALKG